MARKKVSPRVSSARLDAKAKAIQGQAEQHREFAHFFVTTLKAIEAQTNLLDLEAWEIVPLINTWLTEDGGTLADLCRFADDAGIEGYMVPRKDKNTGEMRLKPNVARLTRYKTLVVFNGYPDLLGEFASDSWGNLQEKGMSVRKVYDAIVAYNRKAPKVITKTKRVIRLLSEMSLSELREVEPYLTKRIADMLVIPSEVQEIREIQHEVMEEAGVRVTEQDLIVTEAA